MRIDGISFGTNQYYSPKDLVPQKQIILRTEEKLNLRTGQVQEETRLIYHEKGIGGKLDCFV